MTVGPAFWRSESVAPVSGATLSLLQFDAWPVVDEVAGMTSEVPDLTAGNIVASPTVGGSAGAMQQNLASNDMQVESHTTGYLPTAPLTNQAITHEFYARREASGLAPGSSGWETSAMSYFADGSNYEEIEVYFGVLENTFSGGGKLFAIIGGGGDTPIFNGPFGAEAAYELPSSAYTHIALVIEGTNLRVYAAGVKLIDVTLSGGPFATTVGFVSSSIYSYTYTGESVARYVDSVRVTDGALYTGDFTPPAGPLEP